MLWSLILIVVVSLFLCACSAGDDTEEKNKESRDSQLYEDIKKSIVRLEIDKSAGSGIVWSIEDGKIIIVSILNISYSPYHFTLSHLFQKTLQTEQ